jgi:hypothetical protein
MDGGLSFYALASYAAAAAAVYGGVQANKNAKADAKIAEQNKKIALQQSSAREESIRRHNRLKLGAQRAAAAQTGFDPNSGSLLELQGDSAGELELDATTARYDGVLNAISFQNQADRTRAQGRASETNSYLSAAGSLLGSMASPYGRNPGFSGTQAPAPVVDRSFRSTYALNG